MAGKKHSPEVVEKMRKAVELRKGHASYQRIADHLECSVSTAYGYVQDALAETLQEPTDDLRRLICERLDLAGKAMMPRVLTGEPRAVEVWLKIEDRRSAMLGIDAPQRRIVEVVTEDELTKVLKELEREIEAMEGDGQVEGELVEA